MRKFLVKIFNLIFLVGCGLSLFTLATRPMIQVAASGDFTSEEVGKYINRTIKNSAKVKTVAEITGIVAPEAVTKNKVLGTSEVLFNVKFTDGSEGTAYPTSITLDTSTLSDDEVGLAIYNDFDPVEFHTKIVEEGGAGGRGPHVDFLSKLSAEKISEQFPNGLKVDVPIKVEAKYAYSFSNKEVVREVLVNNVYAVVDGTINKLTGPLHSLLKSFALDYAKDTLKSEVAAQIDKYFTGDNATVDDETIEELFDNIYERIDGEEASLDDLAAAILGKDSEGNTLEGTSLITILNDLNEKTADPESGVSSTGTSYNPDNISADALADKMAESLSDVPGLVEGTGKYDAIDPKPSVDQVTQAASSEKEPNYYLKDGDNYVRVAEFNQEIYDDPSTVYYKQELKVNDVDKALALLISSLGSSSSSSSGSGSASNGARRAIQRAELTTTSSKEELRQAISDFMYKALKLETFESMTLKYTNYIPYVLLGIIVLFAIPWALLAVSSLVGIFRRDKFWVKPGLFLLVTWPQVILGIVLTYGWKYFSPLLVKVLPQYAEYINMFSINARTGCLIPSFVFCAFALMTIPYLMLVRPFKRARKLRRKYGGKKGGYPYPPMPYGYPPYDPYRDPYRY